MKKTIFISHDAALNHEIALKKKHVGVGLKIYRKEMRLGWVGWQIGQRDETGLIFWNVASLDVAVICNNRYV